ncbi:NADPH:quinone oxidoreductase family protein PIG3 [Desulfuromonas sp. DDH964]|uniref:quinone oxidoreductase family protein n=1 Tax=Desulfuromonas sp. DDH964 TaxID=1823759 RepID=UPI00078D5B43|nr:quinone oxidoreductase [Desulfuromonas sp. DDH964]AMV73447.1 NADPH:quinone oxidoreductase family protein PIG3 [Desulfuromonas sp. DDH964]
MTKAVRFYQAGGPEVLRWEDVSLAPPGPGEVHLRHTAVGLNFIDIYHRTGLYPLTLPVTPGLEGAGVVLAVGDGVGDLAPGDRVAYAGGPPGAYAEERLIPAHRLVKLPDWLDDQRAAAMMLQGMTAQYLLRRTFRVGPGDPILVHAAAGGVGLIVCQWARYLGATVIGTVGSPEKAELARDHGCHYPILYREEDFVARTRELTGGEGVAVVYDSIGRDTFLKSLDCLRPLGMLVSFGQASGPVESFNPGLLAAKGSLFLTRPSLMAYTAKREDLLASAAELFNVVENGAVRIEVNQTYPLREAARAQRDLEERKTTGSTVLLP